MSEEGELTRPGGSDAQPAPPLAPSAAWPWLLVGLAVLGVGVAAWSPVPAGVWHDDGVYMVIGKALAGGHGLTYEGIVGSPPAAKFPPLYPAVLAVLWLGLGWSGIGAVTMAATALNLVCLAGGAAALARALHRGGGMPLRWAGGVAVLAFVSTDLLRSGLVPLSESLFLLLAMAALSLWPPEAPPARDRSVALAAVLVALVLTRSAGVAFVAAYLVALLVRRDAARALRATLPALAAAGAWGWWAGRKAAEIPEGTRDLLGPYGTWLGEQALEAPGAFVAGLPGHALEVLRRVAWLALPGASGWVLAAAAVPVAAVAGLGLWRAARALPPLAWAVPAYLAMLVLWPYADRRLVVPLHPLVVALLAWGALELLGRFGRGGARTAVVGLVLAWGSAYSVVTAGRIAGEWPVEPYRLRADRLAAAVEALQRTAPTDAVVGAPEYWAALHLHGGWTVSPSALFDPRDTDPEAPMWGTPDEQASLWRAQGIDHVLLEQGGALHGATLDRLEEACPGTVFLLAQSPPLMVVRLEWDPACPVGRGPTG